MVQKVMAVKFYKPIIVALVACLFSNILLPAVNVFASENDDVYLVLDQIDQEEFDLVLSQIADYSEYDYGSQKWILSYDIVTDGILTEEQYKNAEKSGEEWEKVEALANESNFKQLITNKEIEYV